MRRWQQVLAAIADLTPAAEMASFFDVSPFDVSPNRAVIERNRIRLLWQKEGQIKAEFPTLHDLLRPAAEAPPLLPSFLRQAKQDATSLLPDDATICRFWQEAVKSACLQKRR